MRESEIITWLTGRFGCGDAILGIGDDCCLWHGTGLECLSTDSLVEGVHFLPTDPDAAVGTKAAGAALSDLAAMGAVPVGATIAIHLDGCRDARNLLEACGIMLEHYACPVLGGDTVRSATAALCITVWGRAVAGRLLRRDGGHVGDLLVLTGPVGGSLRSGRHLRPEPRLVEGRWLADQQEVHALIDISDGLATDAGHLADRSGCACLLRTGAVPIHPDALAATDPLCGAMQDGEDYELLFAVDPAGWPALAGAWPFVTPPTVVGELQVGRGSWIEDTAGRRPSPYAGYEHGAAGSGSPQKPAR